MKMGQSIPKRRHIKFRRRGITQKKAYNKITVFPTNGMKQGGTEVQFHSFLTFALDGGE